MIELARGIAHGIVENGVACRFITVDVDIYNNPTVDKFYVKCGFKYNSSYKRRDTSVSMRLDLYHD